MKQFMKVMLTVSLFICTAMAYAVAVPNTPAPSKPTATIAVSPEERAKIEQVVHEYLLKNPDVLMEVIQVLQKKQYEQAELAMKKTQALASSFANPLFHQASDPMRGNATGNITVVEFFDYQCPHCVEMVPTIDAIISANPNIRVIFKDFPVRGPMSEFAARAALAANLQGKYDALSHAMLTSTQPLTQDLIYTMAKNSGLDVDKLKKDMDSPAIDAQLKANVKLAQDLKLFGTPALFIGKTDAKGADTIMYIPGQADQKQLQAMIDKASK